MVIRFLRKLIHLVLVGLLIGCGVNTPEPLITAVPPQTTSAPTGIPSTPELPTAAPEPTPSPQGDPLQVPVGEEEYNGPVPDGTSALASGWSTYSNPDFVRGIAVHGDQLWAATLGGVVLWDLKTRQHQVYTTWDGLAEIQGNDVAYCASPEEQVFVAHEKEFLSVYDQKLGRWGRVPISFEGGGTLRGVRTLFCDEANHRLLAGTSSEIGALDLESGRWERVGPKEGLKITDIRSIDTIGQTIWVAAGKQGARMILGDTVYPFSESSGFPSGPVNDMGVGSDISTWFGYPNSLVHYRNGKWNPYSANSLTSIPFSTIDFIEIGPNEQVWVAGKTEGVCLFQLSPVDCRPMYRTPKEFPITDLVIADDGVPYAATDGGGVVRMVPITPEYFTVNNSTLVGNDIRDIAESQDGFLYVATDKGVNILNPAQPQDPWQVMQPGRSRSSVGNVTGLQPAENGMWFFYNQEARASFFDGEQWVELDSSLGLNNPVKISEVDWMGRLWFGTEQSVFLWTDSLLRPNQPPTALAGNAFQAFYSDDEGMYVGSDQGLLRFERYQWKSILSGFSINAITQDSDGELLLGTEKGLVRIHDNQVYIWMINLSNRILLDPAITSIAWDRVGHLWVGTKQEGLLMYDGDHWEQFDTTRGMPADYIRQLYQDRLGTVWIVAATNNGGGALVRFTP